MIVDRIQNKNKQFNELFNWSQTQRNDADYDDGDDDDNCKNRNVTILKKKTRLSFINRLESIIDVYLKCTK